MTRQKLLYLMYYYVEKQVWSWRDKNVQFCFFITWKSRFSHDVTVKEVYILCIIPFLSRFSQDAPKTLIFDAWLRGKTGFLMTCHKGGNLLHYYVEKQVFPWRAKNSYIWCIITWKSRFSHDATENSYIWCIITKRKKFVGVLRRRAGFLMTHQNLIFDALIREKACFLMTRQKGACCIIMFRSRFSHDATQNKVYIWCIITFRSRFSYDVPKTLIFNAFLHGKAGFLMTRQKGANLVHYYVEKQVFSWRDPKQSVHLMYYYAL